MFWCVCVYQNPTRKIGKLIKLVLGDKDACIPCLGTKNFIILKTITLGIQSFPNILYSARRHPTKLSEAYPSPYICRLSLRRRTRPTLERMDILAIESIFYFNCHIVFLYVQRTLDLLSCITILGLGYIFYHMLGRSDIRSQLYSYFLYAIFYVLRC